MPPSDPIYIFPSATSTTYLTVLALTIVMFGVAIYMVRRQRLAQERARLSAEWAGIETILTEKEVPKEQGAALKELVRRRTPQHPYHAVTQRAVFDEILEAEMAAVRTGKSVDQYNEVGELWRAIRCALSLDFIPVGQSIVSTRDLYLDQKVWLAPTEAAKHAEWHAARVTNVNEAYFFVSLIDAIVKPVKDGSKISMRLWREDDARYAFDCELVRQENRPAGWMMAHTDVLSRTQDRSHFRITHDQSSEVGLIEAPRDGNYALVLEKPEVAVLHGRITSLSGGGFATSVPQPVPPQVLLRVRLQLDATGGGLTVVGKVVGNQPLYGGRYLIRCAFVALSEEDRDIITHYVFRRQTQQRAMAET